MSSAVRRSPSEIARMSALAWMAWTQPVAIFFACIALLLIAMTLWELRSPTVARKGFLPLATTRGDRLFIGLLAAAYINLAWSGLTDVSQWWGAGLSAILVAAIMKWG
jgi:predicted small integral membrane protein